MSQPSLYGGPTMMRGALFSADRQYRYSLFRIWDDMKPKVMFIGLNPSTANENEDDQTIKKCMGFAKKWGYGGIYMTNLFSYVSTDPNKLLTSGEPIEENNKILLEISSKSHLIIFAWGSFKQHKTRMTEVISMFPNARTIGPISIDGFPKHPSRLPYSLTPEKYNKI